MRVRYATEVYYLCQVIRCLRVCSVHCVHNLGHIIQVHVLGRVIHGRERYPCRELLYHFQIISLSLCMRKVLFINKYDRFFVNMNSADECGPCLVSVGVAYELM